MGVKLCSVCGGIMEVSKAAVIIDKGVYYSSVKCVNSSCTEWERPINTTIDPINNDLKKHFKK